MIVRPAEPGDVEGIVALLDRMNPKLAPERWRRLFAYDWLAPKPDLGRVAVFEDRIVGFIGAVYSDRTIAGRRERVVNLSSWYLDRSHRGQGRGLMTAGRRLMTEVTANPEWHYSIITSSSKTPRILRAVGFEVLDSHRYDWRRRAAPAGGLEVLQDRQDLLPRLPADQRRLLADHAGLPVTPMLFRHAGGATLVLFSVTRKGNDQPWYDVLHVDDPDFLPRHGQAVADAILPDGDAVLSADERFCAAAPPGAARVALPVPRFIKSPHLAGHHIDHLYSELQLLNLKLD